MENQLSDFFDEFRENLIRRLVINCIIVSFLLTPVVTGPIISTIWENLNPFVVLLLGTILNFSALYFFWLKSEIKFLKIGDVSRKAVSKLNQKLAKLDRKMSKLNAKIYYIEEEKKKYHGQMIENEGILNFIQAEELVVAEVG